MSFPNKVLKQTFLSEQDKRDLLFGIENDVDFVAASFVSRRQGSGRSQRLPARQRRRGHLRHRQDRESARHRQHRGHLHRVHRHHDRPRRHGRRGAV
ncbi:MAG: hypothetical protein ACLRRN_02470 [Oscillospiraceae bacterium]